MSVFVSAAETGAQLGEAGEAARPRAVSASLCADAYLLALGGPDDIAALSWQSRQPVSAAPDWARDLPQASPSAERLLALDPQLAVFGPGEGRRAKAFLDRAGYATFELDWGDDFESVRTNLAALGDAWGAEADAAAAIADLEARLDALAARSEARQADGRPRPRVVYLSASGGSAGAGVYIDAAIRAAGGVNAAADAGLSGWGRADPEFVMMLDPDLVVTSFFTDGYASIFNRAVSHAAYRRLLDGAPRIDIPAADWPCAGPRLIDAAEAIADALDVLQTGGDGA